MRVGYTTTMVPTINNQKILVEFATLLILYAILTKKSTGNAKKMKKNEKNLDYDEICGYDEHCCSAHDDGQGYCEICGAVVPGSYAYYETYGGEYPERSSDYRDI